MRLTFFILCFYLYALPLSAQEYLDQPICFTIKNNADHSIYGEVRTDKDVYRGEQRFDGEHIHHSATFRLQEGEDYPVCTTGPLYPGNKMLLILRTFIPVFECRTAIYPGAEININSRRRPDESGVEIWAECL